mgnify:CR=1 FL=1
MNAAKECDEAEGEIIVWVKMMISQFDCGYIKSDSTELNTYIEEIRKLLKRRDEALLALYNWARSLK